MEYISIFYHLNELRTVALDTKHRDNKTKMNQSELKNVSILQNHKVFLVVAHIFILIATII